MSGSGSPTPIEPKILEAIRAFCESRMGIYERLQAQF